METLSHIKMGVFVSHLFAFWAGQTREGLQFYLQNNFKNPLCIETV